MIMSSPGTSVADYFSSQLIEKHPMALTPEFKKVCVQ